MKPGPIQKGREKVILEIGVDNRSWDEVRVIVWVLPYVDHRIEVQGRPEYLSGGIGTWA